MTTKAVKKYWNAVAELGCIPCEKDGYRNYLVSIHHIDGRTKPLAHFKVLGLCAAHHQKGTNSNAPHVIAVHPDKARFEAKYGTQEELLEETKRRLAMKGITCPN